MKAVTSIEGYNLLVSDPAALLIDVRTDKEWARGIPEIHSNQLVLLSWRLLPNMSQNPEFSKQLALRAKNVSFLLFLCRSGVRSLEAAEFSINNGYINCYNIIDGFEGGEKGAGWKGNRLPCQVP